MVTALIKNKSIELHSIEELEELLASSSHSNQPVILMDGRRRRFEVVPTTDIESWRPDSEQITRFRSAAGGWKGLVDGESFKRQISESRGQRPRDWEACVF
ncbi:MAG: hypothetical protein IT335_01995 [Thermomicrobiales bacterium]|nr:hypothetical protein [Thermomicrobiales bacterium]